MPADSSEQREFPAQQMPLCPAQPKSVFLWGVISSCSQASTLPAPASLPRYRALGMTASDSFLTFPAESGKATRVRQVPGCRGSGKGRGSGTFPTWNGTDPSLRRAEKLLCAAARAAHLAPADNRAFELAALERGQGQRARPATASGAGRSLNPPPGSASAIAFCSRISAGSFPLHLQDRSTLPKCGSISTISSSSLLPGCVQETQRAQTAAVPASSWFVLFQRAERGWEVSDLREFSSCRCCTV